MKKMRKGFKIFWSIISVLLGTLCVIVFIFMHFGGFGTGKYIDPKEFKNYAQAVLDITIPENTKIIALGEATHGNVEFQQLKLEVFKNMVENYNVKAFALEGDYGGCEQVNRYIQGGEGTAEEAAAAIGFMIYRTNEMADLIAYMRQYNDNVTEESKLRFYGFDMQQYDYNFKFLVEYCKELGIDTTALQSLMNGETWNVEFDNAKRVEVITQVKNNLMTKENVNQAIHQADILLQYFELQSTPIENYALLRDQLMANNVEWLLEQEQQRGYNRIFITGHNGHVAKWGSYDTMGKLLLNTLDNDYYVIGTDFYKTRCNLPKRTHINDTSTKRTNQIFYSHDPLAKTAKKAGLEMCWLDFDKVPENTALGQLIEQYVFMGSLGEAYTFVMRLLPPSYRIFQPPATLYDSMIFVTNAKPTKIL